jgi:glycine/D-amino acid oxidase-like deaminating enzyme
MSDSSSEYDAIVIGAGIFGSKLALALSQHHARVLLVERESDLLSRASYTNQARVHRGYHYPRSLLTALRSRVNFTRFVDDFADCIDSTFESYYAVGRLHSKVTAAQFGNFCRRIGAELEPAPRRIKSLFDDRLIEDVFRTREYVFDANKLRDKLRAALRTSGVVVRLGCAATLLAQDDAGLRLTCVADEASESFTATQVFGCTYSQLNRILADSGLPLIALKHELTEMALVEVPPELACAGVTVMDGPFYSLMPFPARGLHTLSHVRYTPHCAWEDRPGQAYRDGDAVLREKSHHSRYPHMIRDAARFLPAMKNCRYRESMWEIKTVLPRSEVDDSRPILVRRNHGLPNFVGILGGKVDNVYDIIDELDISPTTGTAKHDRV